MKKIVSILLVLTFALSLIGCNNEVKKLQTPQNVTVSETGVISWDAVENATGYVVTVNTSEYSVTTNSYTVSSVVSDFTYCVRATADGFEASDNSELKTFKGKGVIPVIPSYDITVGISGSSEVKSGQQIQLKANVKGSVDKSVTWEIVQGAEYATITNKGLLQASEVDGDKVIKVRVTSKVDTKAYAEKSIVILSKPELTQEMLNAVSGDTVGFEGYLYISVYDIKVNDGEIFKNTKTPELTYTTVIKTAMNGVNWYAEYDNSNAGIKSAIYYKNNGGIACQVGVNFMNEEEYYPMTNDDGSQVDWVSSGLYNSLSGVKVSDFVFDENEWRYVYRGSDAGFKDRIVSASNPYEFTTRSLSLIIDEGEILGLYAKSEMDYALMNGYKAVQEMFVAINTGDSVEVPSVNKYETDENVHPALNKAIKNMQNLESYTVDFNEVTASYMTTGYIEKGFTEYVTEDTCLFRPYSTKYDEYGKPVPDYEVDGEYGYKRISDTLYNSFRCNGSDENSKEYVASRAFEKDFSSAKASFAFAGEIFRSYYHDEETGETTYYVDYVMSSVASTFYYGVGNDINLYGIFATDSSLVSLTDTFTPYVVVKDEYIVEAGFFFYLGSMYGFVELKYSDFNSTELPEEYSDITFETRKLPTSWADLTIIKSNDSTSIDEDVEVNAVEYFKEFFEGIDIGENAELIPFFGVSKVLGDTFGFGMNTIRMPSGSNVAKNSIVLYYDVPLDVDYTINSSLKAIADYLIELGFTYKGNDEYAKNGIVISPVDSSLDLMIYMWKE